MMEAPRQMASFAREWEEKMKLECEEEGERRRRGGGATTTTRLTL
jgi:hypothetical protein